MKAETHNAGSQELQTDENIPLCVFMQLLDYDLIDGYFMSNSSRVWRSKLLAWNEMIGVLGHDCAL